MADVPLAGVPVVPVVTDPYPPIADIAGWLAVMQTQIVAHSSPTDDPNHDQTDSVAWIADFARLVQAQWPEGWESLRAGDPGAFDENMRLAREVGLLLCAWYASVSRAKSRDPKRPVALRQAAHRRRVAWVQQLLAAVTDDAWDPAVFPGQQWESPFEANATEGTFV